MEYTVDIHAGGIGDMEDTVDMKDTMTDIGGMGDTGDIAETPELYTFSLVLGSTVSLPRLGLFTSMALIDWIPPSGLSISAMLRKWSGVVSRSQTHFFFFEKNESGYARLGLEDYKFSIHTHESVKYRRQQPTSKVDGVAMFCLIRSRVRQIFGVD